MKFKMRGQKGFSLIELMIVVAIIGTLASIALPKVTIFMAKARQSEAKSSLGTLYTLQTAYYNENNSTYGTTAQIGWNDPAGAKYTVIAVGLTGSGRATAASGICTGQSAPDIWTIDTSAVLLNATNLGTICP